MSVQMKDWPIGTPMLVQHPMPPDGEVREILYVREADGPVHYDYNVRVCRLLTLQGHKNSDPRYRGGPRPCRDPGEADGRTVVVDPWLSNWPEEIIDAMTVYHKGAA
jgi:hypothetical protein